MRNLLQNKFAVSLLLIAALGLAAVQGNLFVGRGTFVASGREAAPDEPSENAEDGEAVVTNTPPRYLTGLRDWQQMFPTNTPRRDPFRSLQTGSVNAVTTTLDTTTPRKSLELQAISLHDQRRFAVIGGQVVTEGESFDGFQVITIDKQGVLLRSPDGTERKIQMYTDEATSRKIDPATGDHDTRPNVPVDGDANR